MKRGGGGGGGGLDEEMVVGIRKLIRKQQTRKQNVMPTSVYPGVAAGIENNMQ